MAPVIKPDHDHDEHRHDTHDERDPGAIDDTGGNIPPQLVRSEGMIQRRGLQAVLGDRGGIDGDGIAQPVGGPQIGRDRDQDHDDYPDQSGHGQLVLAQTPYRVGPQRTALSGKRLQIADGDVGRAAIRRGDRRRNRLVRISSHVSP